jgi:hypothetical protein
VVFEAGASNSLGVWDRVLPEVAAFAPTLAYDRAGLGESEWDDQEFDVFRRLMEARGTLVVSNHAHRVPREDPALITWAVRRVLDSPGP